MMWPNQWVIDGCVHNIFPNLIINKFMSLSSSQDWYSISSTSSTMTSFFYELKLEVVVLLLFLKPIVVIILQLSLWSMYIILITSHIINEEIILRGLCMEIFIISLKLWGLHFKAAMLSVFHPKCEPMLHNQTHGSDLHMV